MSETNIERDPIELLASEFVERQRRGERPSVEDYAKAHPELAAEIRDLFPTIAAAEEMKFRREGNEGGRASLGPVKLERLGDFRIVREIGRGGMGIVYEAVQESLGRRVAIKVLPRQFLLNEKGLKRFQREAHLAASLHHTNIAEVFGAGEQDGFHYYVMQFIEGVGLDAVCDRLSQAQTKPVDGQAPTRKLSISSGPVSVDAVLGKLRFDGTSAHWRNVARIGLQVALALSYAHAHGTLHRDIKPANLLIDTSGNVWITDFGLAKALASESLTLSGEIAGTLLYMSPEQLQGESDTRSDLYSLGVTLYELLTCQPAFGSATQAGLVYQVSQGLRTTPRAVNPAIPTDLETIVLKATTTDPQQRYASAADLADDLQRFLDDLPLRARRASTAERLWRWCRRNKAIASLGAATFVLTLLVAIVASIGLASTRSALKGEAEERRKAEANALTAKANAERAEANAALAMEALDRIFERFSPNPVGVPSQFTVEDSEGSTYAVPSNPVLSKGAALLLDDLMAFYDRLAQLEPSRADWRRKVADANRRVGDIRRVLGEYDQAETSYQHALALYPMTDGTIPDAACALAAGRIHNARGQSFLAAGKQDRRSRRTSRP
jgi:serine/threonine protein kinase